MRRFKIKGPKMNIALFKGTKHIQPAFSFLMFTTLCQFNKLNRVLEPVFNGDYPQSTKELVGDRLPVFTEEEKTLVRESVDFIGVNYYRSFYGRNEPNKTSINGMDNYDSFVVREGKLLL